uniref:Uncharacterized protein n=1 Tax=Gossypium raimondii TaxID=29730 RepID=A0A0D2N5K9_GOSRA|nr:hypothetical protein B456_001G048000 [Gossypium raimondii]
MANSMANLSRRVYRSLLCNPRTSQLSMPFCTTTPISSSAETSDSDSDPFPDLPSSQSSTPLESAKDSNTKSRLYDCPLENGFDTGIYKVGFETTGGHMGMRNQWSMLIAVLFSGIAFVFTKSTWEVLS